MPRTDRLTGLKECTGCHQKKPGTPEFFSNHPKSFDRLQSRCKACKASYIRNALHTDDTRRKAHVAMCVKYRVKMLKSSDQYREQDTKRSVRYTKKRYQNDPLFRLWKHVQVALRYRRIAKCGDGTVTKQLLSEMLNDYAASGNVCPLCNRITTPTIDHIIPTSKGGQHTASNIRLICRSCNSSKKDKLQ